MNLEFLRNNYRDYILGSAEDFGLGNVRVFGSFATGETHNNSDLDLLVTISNKISLLKFVRFQNILTQKIGIPVQVISDDGLNHRLKGIILNEAVPL